MKPSSPLALAALLSFAAVTLAVPPAAAQDYASYTPEALDAEVGRIADARLAVMVLPVVRGEE